jgi:hypothetical protein
LSSSLWSVSKAPEKCLHNSRRACPRVELHWLELWNPAETTTDGAADIVKHWIVPALKCCQFRESPVDEVRREIAARMEATKWFFQRASRPPEAGTYIDDVRQPDDVWTPPKQCSDHHKGAPALGME